MNADHALRAALALLLAWCGARGPIEVFVGWYSGVEFAAETIPPWQWAAWGVETAACWAAAAAVLVVQAR